MRWQDERSEMKNRRHVRYAASSTQTYYSDIAVDSSTRACVNTRQSSSLLVAQLTRWRPALVYTLFTSHSCQTCDDVTLLLWQQTETSLNMAILVVVSDSLRMPLAERWLEHWIHSAASTGTDAVGHTVRDAILVCLELLLLFLRSRWVSSFASFCFSSFLFFVGLVLTGMPHLLKTH